MIVGLDNPSISQRDLWLIDAVPVSLQSCEMRAQKTNMALGSVPIFLAIALTLLCCSFPHGSGIYLNSPSLGRSILYVLTWTLKPPFLVARISTSAVRYDASPSSSSWAIYAASFAGT